MSRGADVGAALGVRLAMIGSKVRETSLARTTPAIVQTVAAIADKQAAQRAEAGRVALVGWLRRKGVEVPPDGELAGLLGGLTKVGGWLAQNVIGTAIGFGVGQSLSSVLAPYFNGLVQAAWRSDPNQLLSPAELALAVLRGNLDQTSAAADAKSWGYEADKFQVLIDNTGEPPGLGELLQLWRRGKITDADLDRGIRESRVRSEWIDTVHMLGVIWPPWSEFLDAYLEGQVDEAQARKLYEQAGGDPDLFTLLYNTRGQAPTPMQAIEMLNRGFIAESGRGPDVTTYEQAFLEGPWRNKWLDPFLKLRTYLLPVRSVRAVLASGAITTAEAVAIYQQNGVDPAMAQALVQEAVAGKLATQKDLVLSQVLAAYHDSLMDSAAATAALETMGYDAGEAALILAIEDAKWEQSYRAAAVGRIHSLYVGAHIDEFDASAALAELGAGGAAASKYLALWDIERTLPHAGLTEAQVRAAAIKGVVPPGYYQTWLTDHGYTPADAEILVQLYAVPA